MLGPSFKSRNRVESHSHFQNFDCAVKLIASMSSECFFRVVKMRHLNFDIHSWVVVPTRRRLDTRLVIFLNVHLHILINHNQSLVYKTIRREKISNPLMLIGKFFHHTTLSHFSSEWETERLKRVLTLCNHDTSY